MDDSVDIVRNNVAEQAQRFLGGHGDDHA